MIVIVWTDDVIAGGQPGSANLRNFWTKLCKEFEISDLGEVKDYIGIEVTDWILVFVSSSLLYDISSLLFPLPHLYLSISYI